MDIRHFALLLLEQILLQVVMNQPVNQLEPKQPWVTPQLVELDIKRITQQMEQQEVDLMNYLASDENAFNLFRGFSGGAPT